MVCFDKRFFFSYSLILLCCENWKYILSQKKVFFFTYTWSEARIGITAQNAHSSQIRDESIKGAYLNSITKCFYLLLRASIKIVQQKLEFQQHEQWSPKNMLQVATTKLTLKIVNIAVCLVLFRQQAEQNSTLKCFYHKSGAPRSK